jgi:DHA1 family tetracycline resistance protein-like MFS transporter
MIGVIVLMRLAHDANPSVWTYFTMEKFLWTPADVGYSLMVMGAAIALVYGVLTRIVIPRIGETNAIYFGLGCSAIGFAGYALSTAGWMLYGWMLVWALSGLASPALNSFMSRHMPVNEQGELQGALASVGSLTSIAAPLLLTNLFSYFTGPAAPVHFPGAAFLAAALFSLGAMIVFARAKPQGMLQPAAR